MTPQNNMAKLSNMLTRDEVLNNEHLLDWARKLIEEIQASKQFAKVSFHFENGILQRAIKEESHKPPTRNR